MLLNEVAGAGWWVRNVKFAAPLYEAQETIYRLAGKPLATAGIQDGKLLNFLGNHFRSINPNSLIDRFCESMAHYEAEFQRQSAIRGLLLNDDMRATEAIYLKSRGFLLLQIIADSKLRQKRREQRGDMTLGSDVDPTEKGVTHVDADIVIANNGSLLAFEQSVMSFLKTVTNDTHR